ncbi:hypothetical protein GCM10028818_61750 [Spirosoma horti]
MPSIVNSEHKQSSLRLLTAQDMYVVNQKWTDAGEKRRDYFKHFVGAGKYDFSADGLSLAA